jgi:Tfp pilus assembly protein PilX
MKDKLRKNASVLVMSVFVIALVSVLVIGILQINMSEVWLTQHRVNATQAKAVAEAGLNDALAQIRQNRNWSAGFVDKELAAEEDFAGGQYTVDVNSNIITVTASTDEWQGYTASLEAQITVSDGNSPYIIRIDDVKLNE